MYLAELTCTTRLLLVAVVCLCDLGDSLAIRNLRCEELHINLAVCQDAVAEDVAYFAEKEGLHAHAESAVIRMKQRRKKAES